MFRFPIGLLVLLAVSILIYFGVAHRVLDRMRLTDRAALIMVAAIILGSFIDLPVPGTRVGINVGGAIVPVGIAIYVLSRAGTTKEWVRALASTAITGGVIYLTGRLFSGGHSPGGNGLPLIDPLYLYPLIAGIVAYIAGRSRRSAFIGATLGVLLGDLFNIALLASRGQAIQYHIGGAGAFDAIVLAGIIAVMLAEVIGESRERLQGGPATAGRPESLLEGLRSPGKKGPDPDQEQRGERHE